MEETQNTGQQTPTYIELADDSRNAGNIFNELS